MNTVRDSCTEKCRKSDSGMTYRILLLFGPCADLKLHFWFDLKLCGRWNRYLSETWLHMHTPGVFPGEESQCFFVFFFLLRGRKLFGGSRCRQTPAGRSQRQTDGQPPAGAGQTAAHGLPPVVLYVQVCAPPQDQVQLFHVRISSDWRNRCLSLDEMFQHPDRNSEDHAPLSAAALPAWPTKELCRLSGQSSRHEVTLYVFAEFPVMCRRNSGGTVLFYIFGCNNNTSNIHLLLCIVNYLYSLDLSFLRSLI